MNRVITTAVRVLRRLALWEIQENSLLDRDRAAVHTVVKQKFFEIGQVNCYRSANSLRTPANLHFREFRRSSLPPLDQ